MSQRFTFIDRIATRLASTYASHHPWLTAHDDAIKTTADSPHGATTIYRDQTDNTALLNDAHSRPLDIYQPPN